MDEERQHEWLDEGEAVPCPSCEGVRLNEIARCVHLSGEGIGAIVQRPASAVFVLARVAEVRRFREEHRG
jgi:excinuclease ABC subunit A